MRIMVLTYHSNNVNGHGYEQNDHVALAEDLRLIGNLGIPIVPLGAALEMRALGMRDDCICISFDDGSWFDWHDLEHPTLGLQRSFASILKDASCKMSVHATSFVIVSPEARKELDVSCLVGKGWWGDEWWNDAVASGLMAVENHSWDHQHDLIRHRATRLPPGRFDNIETWDDADREIRAASDYLDAQIRSRKTRLFAYPYGQWSEYLVTEYFPRFGSQHRVSAAFTTEPRPVCFSDSNWLLGRYVCGYHWRSSSELASLCKDAFYRTQH